MTDLRDQITKWRNTAGLDSRHGAPVGNALEQACDLIDQLQPALAAKDAEIAFALKRTRDNTTYWQGRVDYWRIRSEQAEAERDQLRERVAAYENAQSFEVACAGCGNPMALLADTAAERDQHAATITRIRDLTNQALDTWKPEHEHYQERAQRKGYSHDETAAEIYGTAIGLVTEILAALDQPDEGNCAANDHDQVPE